MPRRLTTLRLRLTLAYVLVFGLIQAAVCAGILAHREQRDSADLDARLQEQARAVGKIAELAGGGNGGTLNLEDIEAVTTAIDGHALHYQIRSADGTLVSRSPQLERIALELPLPALEELRRERAMYLSLSDAAVERLIGDKSGLRLINHYHVPAVGMPLIVQLGTDLARVQRAQNDRRKTFLAISLLALLPAGLTTWLLAKRSLRPLAQVAEQVRDISPRELGQRIQVEDPPVELVRLTDTVNQMLERLENAFRAQDRFLTNAAHELKTPLTILMGQAQVLRRRERSADEYVGYLTDTEGEMRRLAKTIDGLLMLARAHTRDPDLHPISANDFVTEAVERCQALARREKVRLALRLGLGEQGEMEPIVRGDPRLLSTMVENLVRNAVRLSNADDTVQVEVGIRDALVCIAVRDRGPGIVEVQEAEVFPGFVSRQAASRASGDTGIGLVIVQSVIQLHGGNVIVGNRENGGAEFLVELPLAQPASGSSQPRLS